MPTVTKESSVQMLPEGAGMNIPFEAIHEPGTYVCNWSGHLLRIPEDAITPGRSPLVNLLARDPLFVTKISDSPYLPLTKARLLASNLDLAIAF